MAGKGMRARTASRRDRGQELKTSGMTSRGSRWEKRRKVEMGEERGVQSWPCMRPEGEIRVGSLALALRHWPW